MDMGMGCAEGVTAKKLEVMSQGSRDAAAENDKGHHNLDSPSQSMPARASKASQSNQGALQFTGVSGCHSGGLQPLHALVFYHHLLQHHPQLESTQKSPAEFSARFFLSARAALATILPCIGDLRRAGC
jgi:hypothetical protein